MPVERFFNFARRVINYFENNNSHILLFVLTFIFIIIIRNLLEVFSTGYEAGIENHYHYVLFYISIVSVFILLFSYASKEKVEKVSKLVLSFSILILIAPLLDLIVNLGGKVGMEYMLPVNTDSLIISFLTFGGFSNLTFGLRLEVALIVFLGFVYFLAKTNMLIRSLFFVFIQYTIIFAFGLLPFVREFFFSVIGTNISVQTFYHLIFTLILFSSLIWIGYLYDRTKFIAILRDIRFFRILHYILFFCIGLLVGLNWQFDIGFYNYVEIFICFIVIFLAGMFSIFTNNIADYKIDSVSNKERPLIKGAIRNKDYIILSVLSIIFLVMFSILIDYYILFFSMVLVAVYFLYSMPPWRLKRVPVFSKLMIAFNTFVVFLMGHYYIEGNLDAPFEYKILILVFFGLQSILLTLKTIGVINTQAL